MTTSHDSGLVQDPGLVDRDGAGEPPLLLQFRDAFWAHKTAVIVILVFAVAVGILLTVIATPYYTAETRIQINRDTDRVTNVESVQNEDLSDTEEFYLTQYSLLESRALATRVVNALNLTNNDEFYQIYGESPEAQTEGESGAQPADAAEGAGGAVRSEREKVATDILLDHVTIMPVAGSSLVDLQFSSPDRRLAAQIANAWVEQYIQSNLDRRFASTEDARKFLTERLAELRDRLEQSEREAVNYADQQGIVELGVSGTQDGTPTASAGTLVNSDLRALNTELAAAKAARIGAQARLQERGSDESTNATLAGLRQKRAEVASEYAKLLAQFEPGYPAAQALKSQIDALDQAISNEESRSSGELTSAYRVAAAREQALEAQVAGLKGQLSNERTDSIQLNIFQREVDTNRALYDGLLQRYKEIGVVAVGSNNIAVVDRAQIPEFPSSPNLPLNLAMALLAGLGLAVVYVFVTENVQQVIREPSEVSRNLGLVVLGSVPSMQDFHAEDELANIKSETWEAYTSIETSLSLLTANGVPKSFLLTSTQPNEGKSTSAVALARVLANSGRRILLIDGDIRNPSLHKIVGMQNEVGLSSLLTGQATLTEAARRDTEGNMDLITAGPQPPNAAQILTGPRLRQIVEEGERVYDHVVIDSPPVLGLADALLLGNATSGILYTISANGAKVRQIEGALRRIKLANIPILGAIVTKTEKNAGYGGYEYYGYGRDNEDEDRALA